MSKTAFKSIHAMILGLAILVSVAVTTGAAEDAGFYDTVELKNGEKVTGTVLNDTFTVTTPYTDMSVEKDKISEIQIDSESEDHDVIVLVSGGSLEGTIEEPAFSFELVSGETVSLEKAQCRKIILKK